MKVFKRQYNLGCVEAGVRFTAREKKKKKKRLQKIQMDQDEAEVRRAHLNRPILLKCENISPPGTYSMIIYRLLLSCGQQGENSVSPSCKSSRTELGARAAPDWTGVGVANLERVFQSHQEGEVDGLQDTFLIQCVFYLLQLHHLRGRGGVEGGGWGGSCLEMSG